MAKKPIDAAINPLDAYRGTIAIAIQECGLPLSARAVEGFVDRIAAALAPMIADLQGVPLDLTDEAPAIESQSVETGWTGCD